MRISVKILNGQEYCLVVSSNSEVREVKGLLHMLASIPTESQRLLHQGTVMMDTKFLKDYNIEDGSRLTLVVKKGDSVEASPEVQATGTRSDSACSLNTSELDSDTTTSTSHLDLDVSSLPPVWNCMLNFLRRHFREKDAVLVLAEYRKNFELELSRMSLDDIEKMAAEKLQQQQQ